MANLICDVKKKSILCEIKSLNFPSTSIGTQNTIEKVLSNKKNPKPCPDCGRFIEGDWGLKLHIARSHKKN